MQVKRIIKQNDRLYKVCLLFYRVLIYPKKAFVIWRRKHGSKIRKIRNGKDMPDKTFFIIFSVLPHMGLGGYLMWAASGIKYALSKGYIPIIDMQNHMSPYIEKEDIGRINVWELYFDQPLDYHLSDIEKARNVYVSGGDYLKYEPLNIRDVTQDIGGKRKEWQELVQRYMPVNEKIVHAAEEKWKKYFSVDERVLGLFCRGTDYFEKKFKGHPVQPEIPQIIKLVYETIEKYNYNKIFLSTEDLNILKAVKKEFGEMVITSDREQIEYSGGLIATTHSEREREKYLQGFEYLVDLILLSKCQALVGGQAAGALIALLYNKEYEYINLLELGDI